LICLNLPPSERFKRENIVVVGFIPGPNNPTNMDSFLYPLVEEFLRLERGVEAWNGYREKSFTLRAHIAIVTGDMPGRAKLQGFKGSRASRYCSYCYAEAVSKGRATYCPFHMPETTQSASSTTDRTDYDILRLPLRNDADTRQGALDIVSTGSDELAKKYGINHLAILSRLRSIDLVQSFPPDAMHLFLENIIPDLVKHWRGRFDTLPEFSSFPTPLPEDTSIAGATKRPTLDSDHAASQPPLKRRTLEYTARRSDKFCSTADPWNVPPAEWDSIGRDTAASHATFPVHFGEALRDFWEHSHHLKAAEWQNTGLILLPIYLKDVYVFVFIFYCSYIRY
jgi:hypothetical protein